VDESLTALKPQDLVDMIYGAALLGAGGGGSVVQGLAIVRKIVDSGNPVEMVSLEEVGGEELAVVSAGMGSPLAAKYGWRDENLPAFDLLEKYLGKRVNYVVPIEIGAGNVAVPLHTAAFRGRRVVDGDGAGRAIPELELVTFDIYGVLISPMAISDAEGNGAILFVKDAFSAEKIARHITMAFEGVAGIALYLMDGRKLREATIPGTLTLSLSVGKILRESKERGVDPAKALHEKLDAYVLGAGKVTGKDIKTVKGFDVGFVEVKTEDNRILRVYVKNENIAAEKDGKLLVLAPDLVCWLTKQGEPLTNADIDVGMDVYVLGFKAHGKLRTERALKAFEHLYSDVGLRGVRYIPIEKLIEE
jgi:hypothetical protein